MSRANIFEVFCLIAFVGLSPLAPGETSGTGVVAAPSAAAYADLTNISTKMLGDIHSALPHANVIILYDAPTFAAVPYYASTAELVRAAAASLCTAEKPGFSPRLVPSLDVGTAASGLASLIQLTLPSYSIQGQTLTLDNSALVGSFATAAKETGYTVINPVYLLPAVTQKHLTCADFKASTSLADLWAFLDSEATVDQAKAANNKTLADALDAIRKMKDVLLTSGDKGPPLLGRALAVESLAHSVEQPARVAIVDMRLDAANIDSSTKTILWWRKTRFSANVSAHYWIFSAHGTGAQFGIVLVEPGYANILTKNQDLKNYGVSGAHQLAQSLPRRGNSVSCPGVLHEMKAGCAWAAVCHCDSGSAGRVIHRSVFNW